jgi:hypothetical protein
MTTSMPIGQSQRNKETGEPDDATSIKSGSEGGWEKRPKGPRSQPTRLPRYRAAVATVDSPWSWAFHDGIYEAQFSALWGSPTVTHEPGLSTAYENSPAIFSRVSGGFSRHDESSKNTKYQSALAFVRRHRRSQKDPRLQRW